MKKTSFIFLITFLTFSGVIYSQSKLTSEVLVEYDMILDLNNIVHYNAYLYFNSSNSYFIYQPVKSSKYAEEHDISDNEANINIVDSTSVKLTIDKVNNRLLEKKKPVLSKKTYVIEESIPKIQWTLAGETKKINDFLCKKALTTFRGRKYEVWYCPELPYNYGPWKLTGLPGLILEAKDDRNQVLFSAKKVVKPYHFGMPDLVGKKTKTVTTGAYSQIQRKEVEAFESRFKSQSDRNVDIEVSVKMNEIEKE